MHACRSEADLDGIIAATKSKRYTRTRIDRMIMCAYLGFSLQDMLVKGILTPVRTGVSKITDRAEQFYSYMFKYESIAAENERLEEELAKIEDRARQADSIARENERLRLLLELPTTQEGRNWPGFWQPLACVSPFLAIVSVDHPMVLKNW